VTTNPFDRVRALTAFVITHLEVPRYLTMVLAFSCGTVGVAGLTLALPTDVVARKLEQ
jgi:hypothetical protein